MRLNIFKRLKALEERVGDLEYKKDKLSALLDKKFKARRILNNTEIEGLMLFMPGEKETDTALARLADELLEKVNK